MKLKDALDVCSYPLWVNYTDISTHESTCEFYASKSEAICCEKPNLALAVQYITVDGDGFITIEI